MAEQNKSQLISEAELIEAINADSIISVSLGAGQPQKNVKLSTLASVVAGLIGFDKSVFKTKDVIYSSTQDFNKITESGVYQIATTASIPNNPGINYGVLIVFTPSNGYTIQLAYSIDGTRKLFTRHGTNTWKESSF